MNDLGSESAEPSHRMQRIGHANEHIRGASTSECEKAEFGAKKCERHAS
jgi:hypothetical protein